MEIDPQDQDIVGLLTKLKNAEGQYPEHMFVARRQMYLRRMAEIGMGISVDAGIKNPTNHPAPPVTPATSALLESALLLAILVEASAVAYFYRDQLSDFFETITTQPRVQVVSSEPAVATLVEIQGITPSPAITATVPSATLALSESPTGIPATLPVTPVPALADKEDGDTSNTTTTGGATTNTGGSQADSTPAPNTNDNGNQGNHYGQTPKPERTIESNSSSSSDGAPQDPGTQDNGDDGNNDTSNSSPGTAPSDNPRPPKNK